MDPDELMEGIEHYGFGRRCAIKNVSFKMNL